MHYTIPGSEILINKILSVVNQVCKSGKYILEIWHNRHIVELQTKITSDEKPRENDTYERTDKWNNIGLLAYLFFNYKRRVCGFSRIPIPDELNGQDDPFPWVIDHAFEFEVIFPVIEIVMSEKREPSILSKRMALELLNYYAVMLEGRNLGAPGSMIGLGQFGKTIYENLLTELFAFIGVPELEPGS